VPSWQLSHPRPAEYSPIYSRDANRARAGKFESPSALITKITAITAKNNDRGRRRVGGGGGEGERGINVFFGTTGTASRLALGSRNPDDTGRDLLDTAFLIARNCRNAFRRHPRWCPRERVRFSFRANPELSHTYEARL